MTKYLIYILLIHSLIISDSIGLFACPNNDSEPVADESNESSFWTCQLTPAGSYWVLHHCHFETNRYGKRNQLVFDFLSKKCVSGTESTYRTVGASLVGELCIYNTDCLQGMYCITGLCICLSTYVEINKYCYPKINPSQAGCQYDEQCAAVWPGSRCSFNGGTTGACRCPTQYLPVKTRDGYVCISSVNLTPSGRCPLPELGELSALSYNNSFNTATCIVGSTDRHNPSSTCYSNDDGTGIYMGDTYDCIIKDLRKAFHPEGAPGICCPNKAYTCIQSIATAPPDPNFPSKERWWYNSVTGRCSTFQFNSVQQNSNNFGTEDQCLSYCASTCRRGLSQYDVGSTTAEDNKPSKCSIDNLCGGNANYDCLTIGTEKFCCSSREFICSRYGGLPLPQKPVDDFDPGYFYPLVFPSTRYYFNEKNRICLPFEYQGVGGNFNNFLDLDACESYCQPVFCARGRALMDSSGKTRQKCSSSDLCPTSHFCNIDVCCPKQQTLCGEPQQVGSCHEYKVRYWYNAKTRECEQFLYSGCQGNDNNFESFTDCQDFCKNVKPEPICLQGSALKSSEANYVTCSNNKCPHNYECYFDGVLFACCPVKSYTCTLGVDSGDACGASNLRWHYDTSLSTCTSFTYLGCNGNSNNFATQDLCQNYCALGGCPFGKPLEIEGKVVRNCDQPGGMCVSYYECTVVNTGYFTQSYCCPSRAAACSLPVNQQECSTLSKPEIKYYFNAAIDNCVQYKDYGCVENNANNFVTFRQCLEFCSSTGCKNGELVYSISGSVQMCKVDSDCPHGYKCRHDSITRTNKCCGSSNTGVCPLNERPYIDAMNLHNRECTPNVPSSCPQSYLCRFQRSSQKYYCCTTDGDVCPDGRKLLQDANTGSAQTCYLSSVINHCSTGYSCQSTSSATQIGYCCSVDQPCPSGSTYARNKYNQPFACFTSGFVNSCSAGYYCHAKPKQYFGVCCTIINDECPTDYIGYTDPLTNAIKVCNSLFTCPFTYSCIPISIGHSICCKSRGLQHQPKAISVSASRRVSCYADRDCYGSLHCIDGMCACPSDLKKVNENCISLKKIQCANHRKPFPDHKVLICNPKIPKQCHQGYECAQSTTAGVFICCQKIDDQSIASWKQITYLHDSICPSNSSVLRKWTKIMKCRSTPCPQGYFCHFNPTLYDYICCQTYPENNQEGAEKTVTEVHKPYTIHKPQTTTCKTGSEFLYPLTPSPLVCSSMANHCPATYLCLYSLIYQEFICCLQMENIRKPIFKSKKQNSTEVTHQKSSNRVCNLKARSYIGGPCCADIQCPYVCLKHKQKMYCGCPRNLMIDKTKKPARCVSVCKFWRDGAFCYDGNS